MKTRLSLPFIHNSLNAMAPMFFHCETWLRSTALGLVFDSSLKWLVADMKLSPNLW